MKKILVIIILLSCAAFRANDYILLNTIKAPVSFMTTDNLGYLYVLVNNEFRRYDEKGNLLKTFSDKSHGNIDFVDVTDPLKILLYFRDFRQILFLDNTLSVKTDPIVLDDLQLMQPTLACTSYDNGFWVYDQPDFQLMRFDQYLNNTNQSGNLAQLTGIEIKPEFLIETGGKVYLSDTANGIFIFDKYGTYSKKLPFKNISSFQVVDDNIIYSTASHEIRYNVKTFEAQTLDLPEKNVISTRYEKDRLFVHDSASVKVYSIK
jgi:hypothetical protein